jgi:hypothetical protein
VKNRARTFTLHQSTTERGVKERRMAVRAIPLAINVSRLSSTATFSFSCPAMQPPCFLITNDVAS